MKKYFMLGLLIVGLLLLFVSPASANGGPHGGYTASTDACAGCHRTHTAVGANLLITTSNALCLSCHGAAATGADTDVESGVFTERDGDEYGDPGNEGTDPGPLNAGGFVDAYNAVTGTYITTTSTHTIGDTLAWGNGVARGVTAALAAGLECADCHDPHGTPGYRLLVAGATTDYDAAGKDYTSEAWSDTELNNFCASCHSAYHVTRASAGTDNTDDGGGNLDYGADITSFAHRVGMNYSYLGNADPEGVTLPTGYPIPTAAGDVVCTTCHFAHGSSAAMTALATGPNTTDSDLLRVDNRGVCESCHQK